MKKYLQAMSILLTCSTLASAQDIDDAEEWMCKPVEAHGAQVSAATLAFKTSFAEISEPQVFYLRRTAGSATEWTHVWRGSIETKLNCSAEVVFRRLSCGDLFIDLPAGYGVQIEKAFSGDSMNVKVTSIKCQPN